MALFESVPTRREIGGHLVYFSVWLGVTITAALLHASKTGHGTHEELGLPPCPSVLLFDRPCPGCGLTTSWTALVHGDIAFAFHAHPLGPPVYLIFTITALLALRGFLTHRRFVTDSPGFNRALIVGAFAFFCFGVARMAAMPNYRTLQDVAAMR